MVAQLRRKLYLYQLSVVFSVLFALIGFSYNVWRMEVSEENNTIRTACFEILINLSSLEQLIYTAYYDGDTKEGSPRKGWVKVGLIVDLSALADEAVERESLALREVWSANWSTMATSENSVDNIVNAIDSVRAGIKRLLNSLE
jgi:hypothetical protein